MNASDRLDAAFTALADPTRRAILARLAQGEAAVAELAEPFAMSQPAISKHLKVLERAGLVSTAVEAQRRPRRIEAAPLAELVDWLESYRKLWERNYERLDTLLEEMKHLERQAKKEGDLDPLAARIGEDGFEFASDLIESPVCRMRVCVDPEGNALLLHRLHAKVP